MVFIITYGTLRVRLREPANPRRHPDYQRLFDSLGRDGRPEPHLYLSQVREPERAITLHNGQTSPLARCF